MKALGFIASFLLSLSTIASASTTRCELVGKDPKGTIDEVMVYGFDYYRSTDERRLFLENLKLGAADGYQLEGTAFPSRTSGFINPRYGVDRPVAKRHEGYSQYKQFGEIEKGVRFARFEVLLKRDNARILITTNDGVYTEELYSCR